MAKATLDRMHLLTLLTQWKDGIIDESQLQQRAEALMDRSEDIEELPHDDDRSIVREVLLYLDTLPALLITKDDIDAIREFLSTPKGEATEGWRKWHAYWDSIDEAERRRALRGHPFYFS